MPRSIRSSCNWRLCNCCASTTGRWCLHFSHSVGSNRNSRLTYRFDQNPGHDVEARILLDRKTIVIEEPRDVVRFANEMRTASNLIVQVHSLATSMSSADFKVAGAPAAIDAAYAGCPLPDLQKPRISEFVKPQAAKA